MTGVFYKIDQSPALSKISVTQMLTCDLFVVANLPVLISFTAEPQELPCSQFTLQFKLFELTLTLVLVTFNVQVNHSGVRWNQH